MGFQRSLLAVCFVTLYFFPGIFAFTSLLNRKPIIGKTSRVNAVETSGLPWVMTSNRRTQLWAADDDDYDEEDDEMEEPLAKGIDSVAWLPSVVGGSDEEISGAREGADIIPLFPLGGIVYTPNSEHILNIFEPRYRQMYTDILMNGSKRFVVAMSHPSEKGRFAEMGVLFELEDLKEVSEQTADQIKYICNHKVTGRVRIHKILNPTAWESRDTYLRAEGTIFDDSGRTEESADSEDEKKSAIDNIYGVIAKAKDIEGGGVGNSREEKSLRDSFDDLVTLQHELQEDVRFTKASVISLAVKPGPGKDGLWQTVRLWQSFADQRLMARQNELQADFQQKLQSFLKENKGLKDEELPSSIGFQDLSPELQMEVQELQKRMAIELRPLMLESSLTMQKILEAKDHATRCKLLRFFIEAETKRLTTKKTLTGMFSGGAIADTKSIPKEEQLPAAEESSNDDKPSSSQSIFTDEPDAWG